MATETPNNLLLIISLLLLISQFIQVTQQQSDVASDIAIRLKKEYSDDLVSDLFATSYALIKVARVTELDNDDRLFHFRINDMPVFSDDSSIHLKRSKRHLDNKIDLLRQDNRVEFVMPQEYLIREKRKSFFSNQDFNNDQLIAATTSNNKIHISDEERNELEKLYELLLETQVNEKRIRNELDIEKKVFTKKINDLDKINLNLPHEIDFNDKNFKQQWYLINEGQLDIPPMHDLNVRDAWLSGYTGKNISIVIIDDGLDHEHPDFEGKYVINIFIGILLNIFL